jgi:predicted nucleic acid-binding protein
LSRFVLDASIALAWFLDDPVSVYATRVRESLIAGMRAVVPALWHLEMANGLAVAERRRILASEDVASALTYVEQLTAAIETNTDLVPIRQALNTARAFRLSAYDAVYLDLSRSESLPLATLDQTLRTAATRAGVELLRDR